MPGKGAAVCGSLPVVAAAAGTVLRLRDGMLDGDVSLVGRDAVMSKGCGNSVAVGHGGGWETFYCHLRRGSLTVRPGQRVEKGDRLGSVGSSGLAEFPHVHLGVRLNGKIVDPFVGVKRSADCGAGPSPLWDPRTLGMLKGTPTALYDAGFAPVEVNPIALRRGFYRDTKLSAKAPLLVFWVDAFWVEQGDRLTLTFTGPKDRRIAAKTFTVDKTQARHMRFVGKRKTVDWHDRLHHVDDGLVMMVCLAPAGVGGHGPRVGRQGPQAPVLAPVDKNAPGCVVIQSGHRSRFAA